MKRVAMMSAMWAGWFVAMTVIGHVAYQVGSMGDSTPDAAVFSLGSFVLIVRNSAIAATFLSLWYDFLKHSGRARG